MIRAEFYREGGKRFAGFCVTGHAGFDETGLDIVCASVSSAVMLTANDLTDFLGVKARVTVEENEIYLMLENSEDDIGRRLIEGLKFQLETIGEEFPGNVKVKTKDV